MTGAIAARTARSSSRLAGAALRPSRSAMPGVANEPLAASSRAASPSPPAQEVREQVRALRREHRLSGWNWTPSIGSGGGGCPSPPVVLAHRGDAELLRQRRGVDAERVVARGQERRRHALEQPAPSWRTSRPRRGRASARGRSTPPNAAAIDCMPEADAEQRDLALGARRGSRPPRRRRRPGRPGPGEMTIPLRSAAASSASASMPARSIASLRTTRTSAPAAWSAWTRLNVNES